MKTWVEAWDAATVSERKTVRRFRKGVGKPGVKGAWYHNGLKGDKNQCPTCGEFFSSTSAFDRHRTGSFGTEKNPKSNRRCLTVPEMTAKGMIRTPEFWWIGKSNTLYSENAPD